MYGFWNLVYGLGVRLVYAFSVRKVCIRGIFVYVAFVYGDVRTRGKCGDFSLFEDCLTEIGRPLRGRRGVGTLANRALNSR